MYKYQRFARSMSYCTLSFFIAAVAVSLFHGLGFAEAFVFCFICAAVMSFIQVMLNELEDRAKGIARSVTRCQRDCETYRLLLQVALNSYDEGVRGKAITAVSLHGISQKAWTEVRDAYSVAKLAASASRIDLNKSE